MISISVLYHHQPTGIPRPGLAYLAYLLSLSAEQYLPLAETRLGTTLFSALKSASDAQASAVESTRAKHAEGWGGSFGRKLATGAGVIAGGVLLGVTGGLAAPAIASRS